MSSIRVIIAGPRGRMGEEAVKMVMDTPGFELVAALDRKHGGETLSNMDLKDQTHPFIQMCATVLPIKHPMY